MNLIKNNEIGNGILEMILFVPIALLFLFVSVDIGLSYIDKAMISDAVRETTHDEIIGRVSSLGRSIYQASANGVIIDNQLTQEFATRLADRLSQVVSERRVNFSGINSSTEVKVKVTPVRISINTSNGNVVGFTKMVSYTSSFGNPNLSLGPKVQTISEDEYLNSTLTTDTIDQGFGVLAANYNNTNALYLPDTLGILITLEALSPTINPLFLHTILNSSLGIQIQDFHVLRN